MRFRQRVMQMLSFDVRSTLDPNVHRTGVPTGRALQTARVDVRPGQTGMSMAAELELDLERHEGNERCWRVQLGEVQFSNPDIFDAAELKSGGANPILAQCTWGVDGVSHTALIDWATAGNSFVVSADQVQVDVIVPIGFQGPDPVAAGFSFTITDDMWILPWGATSGPSFTIGAAEGFFLDWNVGSDNATILPPAGTYTVASLNAEIQTQIAAQVPGAVWTMVLSIDTNGFMKWTYTTPLAEVMEVIALNATQKTFGERMGWTVPALLLPYISITGSGSDTATDTPLSDDIVVIPAGTYTDVAFDALVNAQLATIATAAWLHEFVIVGSTIADRFTATGDGVWKVRNASQSPGTGATGYQLRMGWGPNPPLQFYFATAADGSSDTGAVISNVEIVLGETPGAVMSLGATIVPDSGPSPPQPTRTVHMTKNVNALGFSDPIAVPAFARAFRWHEVTSTVAASAPAALRFMLCQDSDAQRDTTVYYSPKGVFTSSETTWPSDDGLTLVPTGRVLWVENTTAAGVVRLDIEFVLDLV